MSCFAYSNVPYLKFATMAKRAQNLQAQKSLHVVLDLLHFVAPRLMQRGDAHFSYGIADNLDDPKYKHYKYVKEMWIHP